MKLVFLIFASIGVLAAQDLPRRFAEDHMVPRWVKQEFVARHMYRDYSVTFQMSPTSISGDFNGDGRKDCAFLIQEKSSMKFGIAIFHARRPQAMRTEVHIVGAGKSLPGLGDNIGWANFWRPYPKGEASGEVERSVLVPILKSDAIHIEKKKKRRGLLLWDGRKYVWHQLKI
jgi:hypothetical protein